VRIHKEYTLFPNRCLGEKGKREVNRTDVTGEENQRKHANGFAESTQRWKEWIRRDAAREFLFDRRDGS